MGHTDLLQTALAHASSHAPDYSAHIQAAITSSASPVRLAHTFDEVHETFGAAPYEQARALSCLQKNCHIGQRKLSLALIEFLTRVHAHQLAHNRKCEPVAVVYPGASLHAALAASDFFPDDKFLCFDPVYEMSVPNVKHELGPGAEDVFSQRICIFKQSAPGVVTHIEDGRNMALRGTSVSPSDAGRALARKPVVLLTDMAAVRSKDTSGRAQLGRFSSATYAFVNDTLGVCGSESGVKRELVLVSDVRSTTSDKELYIAKDMVEQAEWTIALGARYYCFKFRLPFTPDPTIMKEYADFASKFGYGRLVDSSDKHEVAYLSGECHMQMYARAASTEMRLMGFEKPRLRLYDMRLVESVLAAFNAVHRGHTVFRPSRAPTTQAIIGDGVVQEYVRTELALPSGNPGPYDAMGEACTLRDAVLLSAGAEASEQVFMDACKRFTSMFQMRADRHPRTCRTGDTIKHQLVYSQWVQRGNELRRQVGSGLDAGPWRLWLATTMCVVTCVVAAIT